MPETIPKLTKAQRDALAACVANYARTIATREEYEAASPFDRERYRNGFDANGEPILRRCTTMIDRRVAVQLVVLRLIRVTFSRRDYVFARPTSSALVAGGAR